MMEPVESAGKPGGDIPKGSSESRFREALTSWAMKSGWWTEARSIEKKKNGRSSWSER